MRKNLLYLLILILFFSGCEEKKDYDAISVKCIWDGESAQLQRNLARWYNANLHSKQAEWCFEEAYNRILWDDGGIMGYVEFPSLGLILPIFHDGAREGAVHDAASDFPIGGTGNHSVLKCPDIILLEPEDTVLVHILGEILTYQVGYEGTDLCTVHGKETYLCGRVGENAQTGSFFLDKLYK